MLGGNRFEVLDDDPVAVPATQEDAAGFRASMGRGAKSLAYFFVETLQHAPENQDRCRIRHRQRKAFEVEFLAGRRSGHA